MCDRLNSRANRDLLVKKRDVRERPEKEKEQRPKASDCARIKKHLPKRHDDHEHRHERGDAKKIQTPCGIESEEFKISRLKVEQEMVTNPVAREVRILRWEIVSYGKALDQRSVRPEIAGPGLAICSLPSLELKEANIIHETRTTYQL